MIYWRMNYLARDHEVFLFALVPKPTGDEETLLGGLSSCIRGVEYILPTENCGFLGKLGAYIRGRYPWMDSFSAIEISERFEAFVNRNAIDIVIVEHCFPFSEIPRIGGIPYWLFEHNYEPKMARDFIRMLRGFRKLKGCFLYWANLNISSKAHRQADRVFFLTESDKRGAEAQLGVSPHNSVLRPVFGDHPEPRKYKKDSSDLLFSSSQDFLPNIEGFEWFVHRVLPIVMSERSDARLVVTGSISNAFRKIVGQSRLSESVLFTGYLEEEDLLAVFAKCAAIIAPIRFGSGLNIKVLEAMRLGLPIVGTAFSVRGTDLRPGEDCLIADSANEFAKSVLRLLQDERLGQRIGENARRRWEQKFSYESAGKAYDALLESEWRP